jgi:DNA-binding response OmpR family regulator
MCGMAVANDRPVNVTSYNPDPMRALVVDDDSAIRVMVAKILEREGFVVDSARDGFEAIEEIRDHDYDLVLLDLMMPRVDGFAVLRFIDHNKPGTRNNVLVMTALSPENLSTALPNVMYKPFDIDQLTGFARNCRESRERGEGDACSFPADQ